MEPDKIKNILESLFFVAREPLPMEKIEQLTGVSREGLAPCLAELLAEYRHRGIQLIEIAGGYLMGTNPENADFAQKILSPKVETTLSPQALETLAIIAYKQPVTRAEVEKLRGVDSGGVIDTLSAKKLVREMGRSEALGRPYLYGTTMEFLRHFGLMDIASLPPLPAGEADQEALFKSALRES